MVAVLLACSVAAFQATPDADYKEAMAAMATSRGLQADKVASLQREVAASDDFLAHVQLYFYYDGEIKRARAGAAETRKARLDHAFWLLERHPESITAGLIGPRIDQPTQGLKEPADVVERATALWNQALTDRPNDARVVSNAGRFFQNRDRARALDLLERALALKPDDHDIEQALGVVYGLAFLGVNQVEFNGFAKSVKEDPVLRGRAVDALTAIKHANVMAAAANTIWFQELLLEGKTSGRVQDDAYIEQLLRAAERVGPLDRAMKEACDAFFCKRE